MANHDDEQSAEDRPSCVAVRAAVEDSALSAEDRSSRAEHSDDDVSHAHPVDERDNEVEVDSHAELAVDESDDSDFEVCDSHEVLADESGDSDVEVCDSHEVLADESDDSDVEVCDSHAEREGSDVQERDSMERAFGETVAAFKARQRRALWRSAICFVIGLACSTGLWLERRYVARVVRGEVDLAGEPTYEPDFPSDTEALAQIDWGEVHSRLLPAWVIARGRRKGLASIRADAAQRAYTQLRYAVAPDRNLVSLLDEVEMGVRTDPIGHAERIDYLLWAYNDYLDRNEISWRVEATLHVRRRDDATFLTRSYEVLDDLRSARGDRLRLLRRADLTNIDEGFLGHTSARDDGALVMLDQVLAFSVRHVWPTLHAGLDTRVDDTGLAPFVRQEALGAMRTQDYLLLHETAVDQTALIEVAASIHARAECGNRFRSYGLPWNGLEAPDQRALVEALGRSRGTECPEVTLGEAARMLGASERLGSTPMLADAVEGLTTWVASAVSVHELQHVADRGRARCIDCPPGTSASAQDELSAYLESFATEGIGYVALLQACSAEMPDDQTTVSSAPHAQALTLAFAALLPSGCSGPIPEDLYRRARVAQTRFFGERAPTELPEDYPAHITLLERR